MKSHLRWKSVCVAVATAALANGFVLVQPAAAKPPLCTQWGWIQCDPLYARGTPEWFECFEYESTIGCPYIGDPLIGRSPVGLKPENLSSLSRH